jgi:hypothetical protein
MSERINLSVPYMERKKAKKLGARWDSVLKTWYIYTGWRGVSKFYRWVDPSKPAHVMSEQEFEEQVEREAEKLIGKMPKF